MAEDVQARLPAGLRVADEPELAGALQLLALALDEPAETSRLLDRAVAIQTLSADNDSIGVAAALNALGQERFRRWRLTEALELFRSSGRILDQVLPPDHPNRLVVLNNELASLSALGRTDGLVERQRESLAMTARARGDSVDRRVSSCAHRLAGRVHPYPRALRLTQRVASA